MRKQTKYLTQGAILCALYVALSHLQNALLPGSASFAIQMRVAEALCIFALYTPAAIGGLTLGCVLFNFTFSAALPLDAPLGGLASLLSLGAMYLCRNITFHRFPLLSMVMPVLFNALLVGAELSYYFGGGFLPNALLVGAGEALTLFSLGTALYYALNRHKQRLFS